MSCSHKLFTKNYMFYLVLTCLVIGSLSLLPENAFSQTGAEGTSPRVTGITAGRARALAGAVVGLISIVVGWRARVSNNANKRTQAIIALSLGAVAIVLSLIHLSVSAGAVFGSGSGKAGAIVGLVLALIGSALGGLALRPQRG
ncbi:hypothetical protein D3H65_09300 [Paraflavitalea soli]|uniref:Uncharacterized protein n=1 Tax=Paraflavitalea soli TaxID=2315862 RepID=A0A3B7MKH8_9BACT|nr:DUF6223 family protein [Paraflavitalea soli]AXY74157.1 hypothetical protein D3H65_09300 [Paraflavitalea soli]